MTDVSLISRLSCREDWERFYEYRALQAEQEQFLKELRRFIDEEAYLPVCKKILSGEDFPLPGRAVISKMGSQKKRVVYIYPPEENMVLKMLTWMMLRRYDHLFSGNLYSFRPGRTVKDAIRRLQGIPGIREMYSYKADITNYFNSIPVEKLLPMLEKLMAPAQDSKTDESGREGDPQLLAFLKQLLEEPRALDRRSGEIIIEQKGIMAGSPVSAFLANLYLKDLDSCMEKEGIPYARYSDDIILFAKSREEAERCAARFREMLSELVLGINPDKEMFGTPEEGWTFLGFQYLQGTIDIAPASAVKIKQKMRRKTRALRRWQQRGGHDPARAAGAFIRIFNRKLLGRKSGRQAAAIPEKPEIPKVHGSADIPEELQDPGGTHELTWSRWFFPVINTAERLHEIDLYAEDCLRFLLSGKRTKARFNVRYEDLRELGFQSLVHAYYAYENAEKWERQDFRKERESCGPGDITGESARIDKT